MGERCLGGRRASARHVLEASRQGRPRKIAFSALDLAGIKYGARANDTHAMECPRCSASCAVKTGDAAHEGGESRLDVRL
jgi:hypothetical protein